MVSPTNHSSGASESPLPISPKIVTALQDAVNRLAGRPIRTYSAQIAAINEGTIPPIKTANFPSSQSYIGRDIFDAIVWNTDSRKILLDKLSKLKGHELTNEDKKLLEGLQKRFKDQGLQVPKHVFSRLLLTEEDCQKLIENLNKLPDDNFLRNIADFKKILGMIQKDNELDELPEQPRTTDEQNFIYELARTNDPQQMPLLERLLEKHPEMKEIVEKMKNPGEK